MHPKERKIEESVEILRAVGIPVDKMTERRKERVALALLAVANMRPKDSWKKASAWEEKEKSWALTTREIIKFWNTNYGLNVSSGSYDDVRRRDLIYLVEAGIVIRSAGRPDASTNDPSRRYAVSKDAKNLLTMYGKASWKEAVSSFRKRFGILQKRLERTREQSKMPVRLPTGETLKLSFGTHNELQKAIVEEFLPRFAPGSEVLYVGDATNKALFVDNVRMKNLGFPEISHETLPDIVAFDPKRNWIFLVEAVHSSNPISKLRHLTLERMTEKCKAPTIYVSVFKDRSSMRKWLLELSWETEVWLAESPDHLIHFDGDRFLGPHDRKPL